MKVLGLDPSVNFVGWSLFDSEKKKACNQWKFGMIKLEGHNYQMRLMHLVQVLDDLHGLQNISHLVGEWPTFFSSEKGQVAAHENYTIDLAGVVCYLAGQMQLDHRHWHILTASTWKGMVSKYVTARKFFRVFGMRQSDVSEHAIDATMMLHFWLKTYGKATFERDDEAFPESPLWLL